VEACNKVRSLLNAKSYLVGDARMLSPITASCCPTSSFFYGCTVELGQPEVNRFGSVGYRQDSYCLCKW
jgi:hypothetical protein